jgi:hypothetical protein
MEERTTQQVLIHPPREAGQAAAMDAQEASLLLWLMTLKPGWCATAPINNARESPQNDQRCSWPHQP